MHSSKTQRKFIQLRSQGLSLARIAEQIGVSKTTLVNWNRWFDEQIEDLTKLERESSHEQLRLAHQADLTRLTKLRDTFETELSNRPLADLPIEKLLLLSAKLRSQILDAYNHGQLLEKQTPSVPDGLTRRERRRQNMNDLRVLHGLNPIDEDGNEYKIHRKRTETPSPETDANPSTTSSVNKQTSSPEDSSNS
jgi:hypothetical protein